MRLSAANCVHHSTTDIQEKLVWKELFLPFQETSGGSQPKQAVQKEPVNAGLLRGVEAGHQVGAGGMGVVVEEEARVVF